MYNGILPRGMSPHHVIAYWDGGTADRFKKSAIANTATAVGTKIHRANSLTFNGTTTLVDLGGQLVGDGAVTFVGWINSTDFGEGGLGCVVSNGKFIVRVNDTNDCVNVSSDGVTYVVSATNSVVASTETFIAVTRTATGVVNIYKNGVLSGSADQASGAPEAGSTNLIIGNNAAAGATFNGTLSHIRIFNRILSVAEIGQLFNLEK
jgi:hypothetical protein